jgi:biopolymer transport protein ExbD
MSKFKKKKGGELPAISTASLPDIVFMLLFFFMVATVMRDTSLKVLNKLPSADQVEKLKKDRSTFIYAGKPSKQYEAIAGTAPRIQINDKFVGLEEVASSVREARSLMRQELQGKMVVGLKIDKTTNMGLLHDVKKKLKEADAYRIMYITSKGNVLDN